jgi:hypothetical protein
MGVRCCVSADNQNRKTGFGGGAKMENPQERETRHRDSKFDFGNNSD